MLRKKLKIKNINRYHAKLSESSDKSFCLYKRQPTNKQYLYLTAQFFDIKKKMVVFRQHILCVNIIYRLLLD